MMYKCNKIKTQVLKDQTVFDGSKISPGGVLHKGALLHMLTCNKYTVLLRFCLLLQLR